MSRRRGCLAVIAAGIVATIIGCNGDSRSPSGPSHKPTGYEIVLNALVTDSLGGQSFAMIVFDPDSTTVKETIPFGTALTAMTATKNGLRTCFSKAHPPGEDETWCSSWPPTDTLASHVGLRAYQLLLSPNEQYLLGSMGNTVLYALSGLTPVYVDSASTMDAAFLPGRTAFCYHRFWDDTLIVVDYGTSPMTVYKKSLRGADDEPLVIGAVCPSAGGDSLVIAARTMQTNIKYMMVVSTDDLAIIDQVTITPSFFQTVPVAHPGGRYSYWLAEGSSWPTPASGAIYRYDIQTKELTSILDNSDGGPDMPEAMLITPDGRYLYVTSLLNLYRLRLSDGQTEIVDTLGVGDHQNFAVTVRVTN